MAGVFNYALSWLVTYVINHTTRKYNCQQATNNKIKRALPP